MNSERMPIIAGNWKMNPAGSEDAVDLANSVDNRLADSGLFEENGSGCASCLSRPAREVVLFPPSVHLDKVAHWQNHFKLGAQDLSQHDKGAHTGEISGAMLKDVGCDYVLVGHSEKRKAGESLEVVRGKVRAALDSALSPILCVGETLDEREDGRANFVVEAQTSDALHGLTTEDMSKVVVAYEPVWAIGTGKNATPKDAEAMCKHIRGAIGVLFGKAVAERTRVLYGGSAKPDNAGALMAQPNIDGLLVGGASLNANDFVDIVDFDGLRDDEEEDDQGGVDEGDEK